MSVDIFNTLLFRFSEQVKTIFAEVGYRSLRNGCLNAAITPEEFALLRIRAEQDARNEQKARNGHREVTLSGIYDLLPDSIGNKSQLQELEVSVECEYCYLNPDIYKVHEEAKSRNVPVVLTSDMYLDKVQLEKILSFNGFDLRLIKGINVSCEHNGDKSSGILFRKLQSDFPDIPADQILHIGDKIEADSESPKSFGMQSHHYPVITDVMKNVCEYEKIAQSFPENLSSLRKLAVHSTGDAESVACQIGAGILGPAFTVFCDWILDVCESEGKDSIYPFMREAELFEPMLKNAAKKRNLELNIQPLFISRESTWLASLSEWTLEESCNLMGKHGFTIGDALDTLGLEDPEFIDEEKRTLEIKFLEKNISRKLQSFLSSDRTIRIINQKLEAKHELLIEYLIQDTKLLENAVTVDLGFRGTINSNLENALAKNGIDSNAVHLLAFASDSLISLQNKGIDIRGFFASPGVNQDYLRVIQRSSFLVEALVLGQIGSTKEYQNVNGTIVPKLHETHVKENELETRRKLLKAVLSFQNLWYEVVYSKKKEIFGLSLEASDKRALCGLIHRMIDLPTLEEARFLGESHHELNDGSKRLRKICEDEDESVLNEIGSEDRFLKIARMHGVHWPQGVITRSNPYFLLKRKLAQNTSDSYLQAMNDLLAIVKAKDFSSVIIYGAGEVGRALLTAAKINEVEVVCVVDRKESLWGGFFENAEVMSLDNALGKFTGTPFVIGSFEFLNQIEETIQAKFNELNLKNEVFSVKNIR